ncbi:MAG: hypothetical protein EP330_16625 [Deltaproteobacteria bacterium]|nr:MAG: hypothetical protein EP330_16625 [Deltaproteobacteria bacterium]
MRSSTLALVLLSSGCGGKLFTIHVRDAAITEVPAATPLELLVSDLGFGDFVSMDITAADELANQGVEPGDVKDVRLDEFELEALDGDGDLAFLDSLEIWVEAPGLPLALMASQTEFPAGQALVPFDIEDLDLTEYVQSQEMTITTEVEGRRPEAATRVEARFDLAVGVTGQGVRNNL